MEGGGMVRVRISWLVTVLLAVSLIHAQGALGASGRPHVTTGGTANRAQQTITFGGSVYPNGRQTTYFFQYGPTVLYGSQTAPGSIPRGRRAAVTADVGGLAPATRYHYRLIAQNANGIARGADRTFTTRRQPLGLVLAATPNPVRFGRGTTLAGTLTGTGAAGREVLLQSNPFPYTRGFQAATNAQITNAQGGFSFLLPPVPINTQYRTVLPKTPSVVSPIVSLGVAVRVNTRVRRRRSGRAMRVRFSGTVRPARDGAQFAIQKLRGTRWVTIGGSITRHAAPSFSRYAKTVRLRRGGTFRVFVGIADGNYVSGTGRSVRVRVR
jgi:hypothetical protein